MKKSSRKVNITLNELPSRPSKISPEEYEKIFGGECGQGVICDCDQDCCDDFYCVNFIVGGKSKYFCMKT
jgi:hypothetical protein